MPTRLADGLGLESDLGGFAVRPVLEHIEEWFPRTRPQEESRI